MEGRCGTLEGMYVACGRANLSTTQTTEVGMLKKKADNIISFPSQPKEFYYVDL